MNYQYCIMNSEEIIEVNLLQLAFRLFPTEIKSKVNEKEEIIT